MLSKILWSICGLLIILSIGYFVNKDFITNSAPKVLGSTNTALANVPAPTFNKTPVKKSASNPNIFSKAAYLMDADTFYPLYDKDANEKLPVASLTKMTTALVVLENHPKNLQDIVTITYPMIAVEGSDIQLRPGEKISVENLLNGLLIMSGNDTANALADHFGGKDTFVKEMNEKVKDIGALDTEFKDPAGLDDSGFSTAKDLALIAAYGLRNKIFADIVKTPQKTISSLDGRVIHDLTNSNHMLHEQEGVYYYSNAIGVKTGFTNEAGHVMVSCADENKHKIIAIVLYTDENSITSSAKESKKLLQWGFENYSW